MGLPCISLLDPSLVTSYEEYEAMVLERSCEWARRTWPLLNGSSPPTLNALSDLVQMSRLEVLSELLKVQIRTGQ